MSTTIAQPLPSSRKAGDKKAAGTASKRLVSLESFLARYTNREDPFKYEWKNGIVEKKPRTMNRDQLFIFQNLLKYFIRLKEFLGGAAIICEVDMYLASANRTRRADIAYLPVMQMQSSRNGELSVCPFVAEVISKNDQINEVEEKLSEYFDNGVQVVWVIFPKLKQVKVYRSVRDITVRFGDDICSAAPVLPDFEMSVNDIFA